MFGGKKQSFCFLNWQRAKVLLKLEFDTEDQVLLSFVFSFKKVKCDLHLNSLSVVLWSLIKAIFFDFGVVNHLSPEFLCFGHKPSRSR